MTKYDIPDFCDDITSHYIYPMKTFYPVILLFIFLGGQTPETDEVVIRKIFDAALTKGQSYENLRELCKDVGHRLTGSHGDTLAVLWGQKKMQDMGYANVRLQEFETNHWTRGKGASSRIIDGDEVFDLFLLSLGSSIGTGGKKISAKVVEIESWEQLENLGNKVEGKIVFYNRKMNPKNINTFHSYGETVDQRSRGASNAAKYGAVASIVRSVTLSNNKSVHIGNMWYAEGIKKIPSLAISAHDADDLKKRISQNPNLTLEFQSYCENKGKVKSNNVIGEIRGTTFPDEYIVVSGHLDSWDVGEGAHDDGAGIVHALEIINLFKEIGYRPKRSIRCILYMNEENGIKGGRSYAKMTKTNNERHIAAIESDAGGFSPRGFHIEADSSVAERGFLRLKTWSKLLQPYNLHYFEKGYAGTDIHPLIDHGTVLYGLIPDSQRYFDFHHTSADVFEVVNKRELELGCGSIAALVYLIDQHGPY